MLDCRCPVIIYRVSIKICYKVFAFYTLKLGRIYETSHIFSFVIMGHLIISANFQIKMHFSLPAALSKLKPVFKFYYIDNPTFCVYFTLNGFRLHIFYPILSCKMSYERYCCGEHGTCFDFSD